MSTSALSENGQRNAGVDCLTRIEQAYNGLAETARRVADSILQQPVAAVGLSITELAHRSKVSDTTVLRFVRALGYQGYRQFALALAASVADPEDRALDVNITDDDDLIAVVKKVFVAEAQALVKAPQTIDGIALQRAVEALERARRVHCYAVGGSGLLAMEAVYRLVHLGLNCVAVYDPIQIAIQASQLTSEDVAIGFSQVGRTHSTVMGLAAARAAGATTICVTSRPQSPIVAHSDISLVLLELQAAFLGAHLDSKIAELTLIDALATCLARRLPPRTADAVDRLEANIERMFIEGNDVTRHVR
ncbi:MAG: transcriptional regulator [Chloroflexi bacterium]|nr:transcriptional regulator [Chloroflexota bacterium]